MAFQGFFKQSTATTLKLGPFVDKGDGVTYEVGMAAAMNHADTGVRISKNGGAFAARTTATEPVYDAFGYYLVNLDATDTATVGRLKVIFGAAATCLPCEADFCVLEEATFDALVTNAAGAAGGLFIAGSNAATTLANLTVSGTSALGALTATTIAASGAVTAASLTMSGALQAATIVSTGTTTLNALTVTGACTHGSTVLGNVTAGTVTQTGAVSWGATTFATLTVTGATYFAGQIDTFENVIIGGGLTAGAVTCTGDFTLNHLHCQTTTFASVAIAGALSVGTTTTLTGEVSAPAGISTGPIVVANAAGIGLSITGSTQGVAIEGGTTEGVYIISTSGVGLKVTGGTGVADHAVSLIGRATAASGLYAVSVSGPGMLIDGTTAGIDADILGNITGNIVGTVSTCTTNTDMLTAAAVNAEVDTALADIHLDHLLAVDYDPASKPGTATALLNELVESDSGVSRFTVNALEQGPSGTGASAATIADAVWDEVLHTDHEVAGSASVLLQAAGTGADAAAIADAVWDEIATGHTDAGKAGARVWTDIPAILDDTGTAGVIVASIANNAITAAAIADNAIDAGAFAADAITAAKVAADVGTEIGTAVWATAARALTDKAGFSLAADQSGVTIGTVTLVTTATTVTNLTNLPAAAATAAELAKVPKSDAAVTWNATALASIQSECNDALVAYDPPTNTEMEARTLVSAGYATATNLATVAGYLDTEIAAILADTNELQVDWANGGRLDLLVDAILEDTGTTLDGRIPTALVTGRMSSDAVAISGSTSAADKLELSALSIETGAAAAGTLSTTQMTSTLTEATADHYVGRIIIWTSGVLIRQASDITDYVGSGGLLTFTAVTEAPTAGDTFIIV